MTCCRAFRERRRATGTAGSRKSPLDEIEPGDRLLIRQGDVVPVDGTVDIRRRLSGHFGSDRRSRCLRACPAGRDAMSGSTNAGEAFDLTATRRAAESTYAGIVRLVEEAQRSKAPMSRLADRWSLGFLAVTVAIAFAAWWFTGDPIRAVAVLVVATPCPLILAVPVALVAGLSRAAHFGVLIKGAGPLETMARIRTLILDKTGTLTDGRPADRLDRQPRRHGRGRRPAPRRGARSGIEASGGAGHRRGGEGAGPRAAGALGRRPRSPAKGSPGASRARASSSAATTSSPAVPGEASGDHPALAAGSVLVAVAVDGQHGGPSGHGRSLAGGRRRHARRAAPGGDRAHPAGHGRPGGSGRSA